MVYFVFEFLEDVECFNYLELNVTVNGRIDVEVRFRINEVGKIRG